ncbi:hypothetical protein [Spirosoma sordidisoli]|uniref:Uncharacterized protein n=1 Tax=Spirosoma sordidisoli TaxID=2502893 RepID=A0A4Q2UJ30_9BACT|nr:hypothetical protein [Spirosoma sordidisoli]RYC67420.1 hypothetical protein EQG79_25275 [Spirosoma sordidisoli]
MRAIRLIQKPQNGQITFTVPDEMRDEAIIIEFRPIHDDDRVSLVETAQQLFDCLPDPNPDFDWNALNVYEQ